MRLHDPRTKLLRPRPPPLADPGQVEQQQPPCSHLHCTPHDVPGVGGPIPRGAQRTALLQIEGEDDSLPVALAESGQLLRPHQRLQAGDDGDGCRSRQGVGVRRDANPGINPQSKTAFGEGGVEIQGRRSAGDGVEVGEVNHVEAELFAKRLRHCKRRNGRGQLGHDGPVLVATPADAVDHDSAFQVDDGDDAHESPRREIGQCSGGGAVTVSGS